MIGIALALLSAVTSAFSVVMVRRYSSCSNILNISFVITSVGNILLWPLALASAFNTSNALSLVGIAWFALSGVLSPGLVRLLYYKGMNSLGTPVNASIFAVYPLYSVLLALLLLNELMSIENWVGVLLILLGVVFVEAATRKNSNHHDSKWKSLVFPILGGVALGVSSIIRKFALNISNTPIIGVGVAYSASLVPYILILTFSSSVRKQISVKRDLKLFWVAGVGQALTWILAFYALSYEEVSVITPLLSTEPLFVLFFAFFYLKKVENISAKLVASIILTIFGVVLVTL